MCDNGPSNQYPNPLHAGISKENWEMLESIGKVPLGANGLNQSHKQKRLHSAEPGETEDAIKASNHLHRYGSKHSSLGLSRPKSNAASASLINSYFLLLETVIPLETKNLVIS